MEQTIIDSLQLPLAEVQRLRQRPAEMWSSHDQQNGALTDLSCVAATSIVPLADVERQTIERAIQLLEGNIVSASTALGVSPSTLYRKIQSWQ
jgi:DNA-binding NtrC family response regulator